MRKKKDNDVTSSSSSLEQLAVITRIQIRRTGITGLDSLISRREDFSHSLSLYLSLPPSPRCSPVSSSGVPQILLTVGSRSTRQLISLTSMNYGRNFLGNLFPFPLPPPGGKGKGARKREHDGDGLASKPFLPGHFATAKILNHSL